MARIEKFLGLRHEIEFDVGAGGFPVCIRGHKEDIRCLERDPEPEDLGFSQVDVTRLRRFFAGANDILSEILDTSFDWPNGLA